LLVVEVVGQADMEVVVELVELFTQPLTQFLERLEFKLEQVELLVFQQHVEQVEQIPDFFKTVKLQRVQLD
jgi:hypothetical protein